MKFFIIACLVAAVSIKFDDAVDFWERSQGFQRFIVKIL